MLVYTLNYFELDIILIIFTSVFLGGMIKGTVGIGLSMFAVPIIAFFLPPTTSMILLCVPVLVTNILQYISDLDFKNLVVRFENDNYIDADNIPFILNSNMVLMFKTMSTLEGVCKTLNPEFSYYDLVIDLINDLFGADVLFDRAVKDIEMLIENKGAVKAFNNNKLSTEKLNNAQISRLKNKIDKNNAMIFAISAISLFMISLFF